MKIIQTPSWTNRRNKGKKQRENRLNANLKRLNLNRQKAGVYVKDAKLREAKFTKSWKRWRKRLAALKADGIDPEHLTELMKRMDHLPKLRGLLFQSIAEAKARPARKTPCKANPVITRKKGP